ncbi:Aldehyde dehydrogenase family 3 member B1, partial [Trachymyrmex septentrionalis]
LVQQSRDTFNSGKTRPIEWRIKQLKQLILMLRENASELTAALASDLRRCKFESFAFEIDYTIQEIKYMLMNIKEWAATEKPRKSLAYFFDVVEIRKDPYGVVLIMGAWNYPLQLCILPMMGAIAAGNCVIVKPSEISMATTKFLYDTIPKYLDTDSCRMILGGISETTELLKQRFDYIFYTGSSSVGKIVRKAANEFLTPVTLELGGKSPVYIDNTVDISMAAKRILWGKCINVGQTCIAPDYMLCTPEIQKKFIEEAKKILHEWYGDNPRESPDLARIISDKHYQRLVNYLSDKSKIAIGGDMNPAEKFISPTVLVNIQPTDPIMQEEIFGPLLPIININNAYEAINFINNRESPLVLYVFSTSKGVQDLIIDQVSSGAVCVNDTVLQYAGDGTIIFIGFSYLLFKNFGERKTLEKPLSLYLFSLDKGTISLFVNNTSSGSVSVNDTILQAAVETLPFGGVGYSGIGAYHGKFTFDTFTHKKGCLIRNYNKIAEIMAKSRFPPYSDANLKLLQLLTARRPSLPLLKYIPHVLMFGLGVLATFGIKAIMKVQKRY